MHLIYLHGLDSDSNATKAVMVAEHCQIHHPDLQVLRPDLNRSPKDVVALLHAQIAQLGRDKVVLVGSSLGGYFATLLSDMTGVPCVLLNPSIRPDISFRRFLTEHFDGKPLANETVIYTTTGGWAIKYQDLAWFEQHRLTVKYPHRVSVLLKMGDELLDSHATAAFYQQQGASVITQAGGDHRMSDFADNVAMVVERARSYL